MDEPRLKLYTPCTQCDSASSHAGAQCDCATTGSEMSPSATRREQAPMMPVAVRDLVPLLVDAFQSDRTWLKDFGGETIEVSQDLYEVLLAYRQLRQQRAA